jgi:hypothetical protein
LSLVEVVLLLVEVFFLMEVVLLMFLVEVMLAAAEVLLAVVVEVLLGKDGVAAGRSDVLAGRCVGHGVVGGGSVAVDATGVGVPLSGVLPALAMAAAIFRLGGRDRGAN